MGGEGSILGMINSLKSNRQLRRKISIFSKKRSYLNRKKEYIKAAGIGGTVKLKSATKEELIKIRDKVSKQRKREYLWTILFTIILIVPFGFFVYTSYQKGVNADAMQEQLAFTKKLEEYSFFISEGDSCFKIGHWQNAIYKYNKAMNVFPKDFQAHYRLASAFVYRCRNEKNNCSIAEKKVSTLLKYFPKNPELLELKKILKSESLKFKLN